MLAGGYSWRLFFYVETAFAAALLIAAFIFVEESTYHRGKPSQPNTSSQSLSADPADEKNRPSTQLENVSSVSVPPRKRFLSTLKPWSAIDPEPDFFMTIARSFTYFLVPAVFWVISTYGRSSING